MNEPGKPQVNPARIMDMASAFYGSCVLFTASDLGVFAMLAERGGADVEAIAAACELDGRGASLLLDACVALGLLLKDGAQYRNSPEADMFLVPGRPMDLSRALRYNRDVYAAWGRLPELARTGKPVEKPELHLGDDPERTRAFVMAMHGRAMGIGRAVMPQLDLGDAARLLDVGGGSGAYSILAAQSNPQLQAVVLDLPDVVAIAQELIEGENLQDRISCLPGDYHSTPFPSGMDAVNILGVLHQESPDSIRDILRRAHAALEPGGIVHVLDMMTDATHTAPAFSALFAVNMALTTANGWVFSGEELRGWLEEAGFSDISITPLQPPIPHWLATAHR